MKKFLMLAGCVGLLATSQPRAANEVLAWVQWGCGYTLSSLQGSYGNVAPKDVITALGLQFWQPNGADLTRGDDPSQFVSWAHQNNIKALLTVFNPPTSPGEPWNWDQAIEGFASNKEAFAAALVKEVEDRGLDGVDIDFEGNKLADANDHRTEFSAFISTLSSKLKEKGKMLTVCIFADASDTKDNNVPNSDWIGDWKGKVDYIHVMLYNEGGEKDLEGVGPSIEGDNQYYYSYQQSVGVDAGYPASAISMGLPSFDIDYGSDWNQNWSEHFNQLSQIGASVCIWDTKFTNSAWSSGELWQKLATFKNLTPPTGYHLTIEAANGTVDASPSSATYASGTQVTLTATPDAGYKFSSWSGDASGTNATVKITMTGDKTVIANFQATGDTTHPTGGFDMLAEGTWETFVDDMGSTAKLTKNSDAASVTWTLAKMPNDSTYPYLGASAAADTGSYVGLTSISVTYTASTAIYINLTDPVLANEGACFQYKLAASSSAKTVTLTPSMFKQNPDNVSTPGTLNLSKIVSIDFEPAVEASTSATVSGEFAIGGLKVAGTTLKSQTETVVSRIRGVALNLPQTRITARGLQFNNLNDIQQIMVFDPAGRTLANVHTSGATANVPLSNSKGFMLISFRKADGSKLVQQIIR